MREEGGVCVQCVREEGGVVRSVWEERQKVYLFRELTPLQAIDSPTHKYFAQTDLLLFVGHLAEHFFLQGIPLPLCQLLRPLLVRSARCLQRLQVHLELHHM